MCNNAQINNSFYTNLHGLAVNTKTLIRIFLLDDGTVPNCKISGASFDASVRLH